MVYCENCGAFVDESDLIEKQEALGEFWGQTAINEYSACPICGEGAFEEARECCVCGGWFKDERFGQNDYCPACVNKIEQKFKKILKEAFDEQELELARRLEWMEELI